MIRDLHQNFQGTALKIFAKHKKFIKPSSPPPRSPPGCSWTPIPILLQGPGGSYSALESSALILSTISLYEAAALKGMPFSKKKDEMVLSASIAASFLCFLANKSIMVGSAWRLPPIPDNEGFHVTKPRMVATTGPLPAAGAAIKGKRWSLVCGHGKETYIDSSNRPEMEGNLALPP
jgi:hypothetical protein